MMLVITIIFILMLGIGIYFGIREDWDYHKSYYNLIIIFGIFGIALSLIAMLFLGFECSEYSVIDEKINMYEEENTRIENQIAECVKQYQKYENDVFTNISSKDFINLVSLYPELKSDTLVQRQIETYATNNDKIKELKEDKIEESVVRWWLYFGGGNK